MYKNLSAYKDCYSKSCFCRRGGHRKWRVYSASTQRGCFHVACENKERINKSSVQQRFGMLDILRLILKSALCWGAARILHCRKRGPRSRCLWTRRRAKLRIRCFAVAEKRGAVKKKKSQLRDSKIFWACSSFHAFWPKNTAERGHSVFKCSRVCDPLRVQNFTRGPRKCWKTIVRVPLLSASFHVSAFYQCYRVSPDRAFSVPLL